MTPTPALIAAVEASLAAARLLATPRAGDFAMNRARERQAMHLLAAHLQHRHGAAIENPALGPAKVRLAGIKTTSRRGLDTALTNWLAAARWQAGNAREAA